MHEVDAVMKGLESRAAGSLSLAGDAGEPLLLVLALLNAAEVSWLKGRQVSLHVVCCLLCIVSFLGRAPLPFVPRMMSGVFSEGTGNGKSGGGGEWSLSYVCSDRSNCIVFSSSGRERETRTDAHLRFRVTDGVTHFPHSG